MTEQKQEEADSRSADATGPPAYNDAHTHQAVSHSTCKPATGSEESTGARRRTFSREQGADASPLQDTGPSVAVRSSKSGQRQNAELADSDSKLWIIWCL